MSFERFSTSDVYIFEHVNGFIQCCACSFVEIESSVPWPELKTPRAALAHLDIHEMAGHDIGGARVRIEKEYPNLDIEIKPYERQHPPQRFRDKGNGE